MLFTPSIKGNYDITLLVESFDQTTLYEEVFIYNAIGNNILESTLSNIEKIDSNNKTKTTENELSYTIQVASWPTMEQAKQDQINLSKNGYDSYIEQYYIKSRDETWWRVRVGYFTDKSKAEIIKNSLSQIKGNDLWIDFSSN